MTEVTLERFPGILFVLAHAGFIREAATLSLKRGGTTIVIPSAEHIRQTSPLVQIVGWAGARLLADKVAPGEYYVPLGTGPGRRMRDIIIHPSKSTREVARDLGTSESWVRRVRNDNRKPQKAVRELEQKGQGNLFDTWEFR